MKYTKYHFFVKLLKEDKWLLRLFIISIIIVLLCVWQPFYVNLPESKIDSINNVLLSISSGYASGYIIYLLSVVFPKASRMVSILYNIKENIMYAKDTVGSYFFDKGGPNELDKEDEIDLIQYLALETGNEDWYQMDEKICSNLQSYIRRAVDYLQLVISHSDYLDIEDIEDLKKVIVLFNKIDSRLFDKVETMKVIEYTSFDLETKERLKCNSRMCSKNEVMEIAKNMKVLFQTLDIMSIKYNEYFCK